MVKKLILAALMIGLAVTTCYAGSVNLSWDPYTDVADGIRIYASKKSPVAITPTNMVGATVGTTTNTIYINNLPNGMTYFTATAYWQDLESSPSNEVSKVLKPNRITNLEVQ